MYQRSPEMPGLTRPVSDLVEGAGIPDWPSGFLGEPHSKAWCYFSQMRICLREESEFYARYVALGQPARHH